MSYKLPKLSRYIPLWKRNLPKYPLYWKGDPQLRLFMPLFWMRVLKPRQEMPPDQVLFETHPQMTDLDIKNYLEKIYDIPVQSVKTSVIPGEFINHAKQFILRRENDRRLAYVHLKEGHTFEFPEIFEAKPTEEQKIVDDFKQAKVKFEKTKQLTWQQADIPEWFR